MSQPKKPKMPTYMKFVFGGTAGMLAACVVQPLELLKNRMQMSGMGLKRRNITSFQVFANVITNEGILALYNGLSAALLRQATYTTTRMGIFQLLIDEFTMADGTPPGFALKAVFGMCAGIGGAFVGTPADVALIRMTSDGRLPPAERRNYQNVVEALFRIARTEGVLALWRGAIPTMGRAMVVNAAQLGTYSQSKELLLNSNYFEDNVLCHFMASMMSGLVTTIASMPVDIAKTRIQNMRIVDGKPEFKGALDVIVKVIRKEGIFALWKGFTPYYMRLGPHTVLVFIFLEQLNAAYYRYASNN